MKENMKRNMKSKKGDGLRRWHNKGEEKPTGRRGVVEGEVMAKQRGVKRKRDD